MPILRVNRFARNGVPVDEMPFAVTHEDRNAQRLLEVNHLAAGAGLEEGMTLADARAVLPGLVTLPEEPGRDALFLRALQRWSDAYTPWSVRTGDKALTLNITGCAHLFGGEEAMAKLIVETLSDLGIEARAGIADTKLAAKAAALYGDHGPKRPAVIIAPGDLRRHLALYPIEALGVAPDMIFECRRLGLKKIADLYPLKSKDLARRFGLDLVTAYEQLMGLRTDPVLPERFQPSFAARMSFPDPIGLSGDVAEAARRLCEAVCRKLEIHGHGARRLRLQAYRADRDIQTLEIGLARPGRDVAVILRQIDLKLGRLDAGPGLDMIRLEAIAVEPFDPQQADISDRPHASVDELISTLGNRLGFDRVLRWEPVSSHEPVGSFRWAEASSRRGEKGPWPKRPPRPLTNLGHQRLDVLTPGRPPQHFAWRGASYSVIAQQGPERIGHQWWNPRAEGAVRDYWQVQTAEGPRYWLSTLPGQHPSHWDISGVLP